MNAGLMTKIVRECWGSTLLFGLGLFDQDHVTAWRFLRWRWHIDFVLLNQFIHRFRLVALLDICLDRIDWRCRDYASIGKRR